MQSQETAREQLEAALATLTEFNRQLRKMNAQLAGRTLRPELRVLQGGRAAVAHD